MKKKILLASASMVFLLGNSVQAAKPVPPPDPVLPHADKISAYTGPETCMACHPASIADDIFSSLHFTVRSENPSYDVPGGGSHGMLDRACGLPGTTLMANNWAGTAVSPVDGITTRDDGCGKCHIAYKPPMAYMSAAEALPDLDCLRCHAIVYGEEWTHQENIDAYGENTDIQERHVVTMPDGNTTWSQDRSLKSAQSVGGPVTVEACMRCHEHGLSGYKRATPFSPETDVHSNKGMLCQTCHTVQSHKIARGNYVTDGMATDLPNIDVTCTNCHSVTAPHSLTSFADDLNRHVTNVTCETCHIHQMEETPQNIFRRAWAPYTLDPSNMVWDTTLPTTDGLEYPDFWDAYTEYFPVNNSRPEIRWFNGGASMLAQPYGGYADRRSAGGDSRLFAFKPFVSGMLFEAAWLPGPQSDPNFDPVNGTWPGSMKYFYEQNWPVFLQMGMVDSSYPTAASYWTAREDMAVMLNNFPMMLQFNRKTFLEEGGTVTGSPTVGPQSAATYPGIVNAINNGMGKMAIDMGYFPPETDLNFAGSNMWSGNFFGMWVPINMDPSTNFYGEVASFITMSHAITNNVNYSSTSCFACHYTDDEYAGNVSPDNKYLSYADLDYPDLDANGMIDPMHDKLVETICDDNVDNDNDGLTDCDDSDCVGLPECPTPAAEECLVPGDEDGNGLADCADPVCAAFCTGDETKCTDGRDNDKDTAIDCADPDCFADVACAVCEPTESTESNCSDGIDSDCDGVADCDDSDCTDDAACAEPVCEPEICDDGIDNDCDGKIDGRDRDCK